LTIKIAMAMVMTGGNLSILVAVLHRRKGGNSRHIRCMSWLRQRLRRASGCGGRWALEAKGKIWDDKGMGDLGAPGGEKGNKTYTGGNK